MKNWVLLLVLLMVIPGCTYDKYNSMVMRQNQQMFEALGNAMSKQTTEGGRMALALMFIQGAGRQRLHAPESAATYVPLINSAVLPWVAIFHHGGSDDDVSQSYEAGRDLIFQSTIDDNSHSGNDLLSRITGNQNSNTQYVCPNCPDGVEGGDGGAGIEGGVDSCRTNPPAGYQGGIPLFSPGCSCPSHYLDKKC